MKLYRVSGRIVPVGPDGEEYPERSLTFNSEVEAVDKVNAAALAQFEYLSDFIDYESKDYNPFTFGRFDDITVELVYES